MTPPSPPPSTATTLATTSPEEQIRNHHTLVWSPGKRGGGQVPADFRWGSNPKQWQEENGTADPKPVK